MSGTHLTMAELRQDPAREAAFLDDLADVVAKRVLAALDALPDDRPLLTLKDVAERLGITERAVRAMVNADPPALASITVAASNGSRRVEAAEFDRYISERRQAS